MHRWRSERGPAEDALQIQKPVLAQEQKLRMNPQLFQSIQLMMLPIQELKFRIDQELEQNPALDIVEDSSTLSLDEATQPRDEEYDYFENTSDPGFQESGYDDESSDNKRRFMEGALSRSESLHDHLLWQLRLQPISDRRFELGEAVIMNLDENGFHSEDPYTLVPEEDQEELREVIEMIRSLEPQGTAVSDYQESLLVQTALRDDAPEGTETVLRDHLLLLEKGKYADIARKLKSSEEQVQEILAFVRSLTPFPGREYSNETTRYVIPDLLVTMKEGELVIILNDEEIPVLSINPFFEEISSKPAEKSRDDRGQRAARRFANSSVKDARWFIHSIQLRNQTLLKVARAIIDFQRDFFVKGPKYLVPLTLKDIAAEVGVHEATVSRITTAKYMQTDFGIFELKYFFSNSISGTGSGGSRFSKEGVKETIREILEEESKSGKHLSDQRISDLLKKQGIQIARRTVAKYRKELDISSSYDR